MQSVEELSLQRGLRERAITEIWYFEVGENTKIIEIILLKKMSWENLFDSKEFEGLLASTPLFSVDVCYQIGAAISEVIALLLLAHAGGVHWPQC